MSTPYGFGGGFLEGLAGSYANAQRMNLEQSMAERKNVWDTLSAALPNSRPEAQVQIFQKLAGLASTPLHKKLDKSVTDFSDIIKPPPGYGASASQPSSGMAPGNLQSAVGQAPEPSAFAPVPLHGGGMPTVPGIGPYGPPKPATGTARVPSDIQPPPVLSSIGQGPGVGMEQQLPGAQAPTYSPWYSPEEQTQQAAARAGETASAQLRAQIGERAKIVQEHPDWNFQQIELALGHQPTSDLGDPITYVGPHGEKLPGMRNRFTGAVIDQHGQIVPNAQAWDEPTPFKTFLGAVLGEGGTREQAVNLWNSTYSAKTGTIQVAQPDGTIKEMPIQTGTVTSKGQLPTPGSAGGAPTLTPPPAGITGPGTAVGGKIVPEVSKAFEAVNSAQGRLETMKESLPAALGGDQQAMVNLLGAHIGMTVQGNSIRGTQGVWEEAARSTKWLPSVLSRFMSTDPQTGEVVFTFDPSVGIVLNPDQMKSMVQLGEQRVKTAQGMYDRTRDAVKNNFGMNPPPGAGGAPKSATKAQVQAYATKFHLTYKQSEDEFAKEGITVEGR